MPNPAPGPYAGGPQQPYAQGMPQPGPVPGPIPGQGQGQVPGPPYYGQRPPSGPGRGRIIARVIGGVVVLGLVIAGFVLSQSDPDHAKAGDCMTGSTASELKITKCSDPDAQFTVEKVVKDSNDDSQCDGTGADRVYTQHRSGSSSDELLLCLKER
ncbi:hypothetical protein BIV57_11935 [Mangrovactinospora gilvigrisea]|uniref:Uncharacterized protein n=1 Tax=Mangrovactinospora gilvigrisea TaxID=1428644 RepID=A0A1J7BUS6_9ACTN|nr:hypothetical protein BIV57_11935 [Mangrovactinospora gilvigrisea]